MAIISDIHQHPWSLFCLCYIQCFTANITFCFVTSCLHLTLVGPLLGLLGLCPVLSQVARVALSPSTAQGMVLNAGLRSPPGPPAPHMLDLAHLVVVANGCFAQLPFKIQLEGKIQVPLQGGKKRGRRGQYSSSTEQTADLSCELLFI